HEEVQCARIYFSRLDPQRGGVVGARIGHLLQVALRIDAGLEHEVAGHEMSRCRADGAERERLAFEIGEALDGRAQLGDEYRLELGIFLTEDETLGGSGGPPHGLSRS